MVRSFLTITSHLARFLRQMISTHCIYLIFQVKTSRGTFAIETIYHKTHLTLKVNIPRSFLILTAKSRTVMQLIANFY